MDFLEPEVHKVGDKMKRRIETSKKVLGGTLISCLVFSVVALIGWFMGREDALGILALVFALATLVVRYYMKKAEKENLAKIKKANNFTDQQLEKLVELSNEITKE